MSWLPDIAHWGSDYSAAFSAVATAGSTLVTLIGSVAGVGAAIFVGLQLRQGGRAGDLTSHLTFHRDTQAVEEAFATAESERKDDAFHDLMNHLECYAGAYNGKLFGKTSKKFVKGKLCDSIAMIQNQTYWASKMDGLLTSPRTFAELRRFSERNRGMIRETSDIHRAIAAAEASIVVEVDNSPSQIPENAEMSDANTHS